MKQDIDNFLMITNSMIKKGRKTSSPASKNKYGETTKVKSKDVRIKVNDKTATGGWY